MKLSSLIWPHFFLLISLFAGCGRNTDFLSHITDPLTHSQSVVHQLKDIRKHSGADILWVVANNPGMEFHNSRVAIGANSFMKEIVKRTGWDWKMGIISMDPDEAPFAGFPGQLPLDANTPNVAGEFSKALKSLGSTGSKEEQAFDSIQKQLTASPGFLRDDSSLIVIFISDGMERSNQSATDFMNFMLLKKHYLDNIIMYGAFASNQRWGCADTNGSWDYTGSPFEQVITASKGGEYHLCFDFGVTLGNVGKDLVTRILRPYIVLKERPILATLKVVHKGQELMGGVPNSSGYWVYDFDLNRIFFHDLSFAPGEAEEVLVSYEVEGPGEKVAAVVGR